MDLRFNHVERRLDKVDDRIGKLDTRMEKSFAAVADDVSKLATKDQIIVLHAQVNSIEDELKRGRYGKRVADLEEEVFGAARA